MTPELRRSHEALRTAVARLPGVGPRVQEKLRRLGIETVGDLLFTLPLRYEDRRTLYRIGQLPPQGRVMLVGEILAAGEVPSPRGRSKLFEVIVGDGSGRLALKWFHYRRSWMQQRFTVGRWLLANGDLRSFGPQREILHPDIEFLPQRLTPAELQASDNHNFGRIVPIYPLTEGLNQKLAQRLWKQAFDLFLAKLYSPIPEKILELYGLPPLRESLARLHWPPTDARPEELEAFDNPWRRRLVFDEFFFLQLGLALRRRGQGAEPGIAFAVNHVYTRPLAKLLPFALTEAQKRVLGEIKRDMMQPHPMHRLLQGDVGSGKTVVALMAALIAIENGYQVAAVAPTEILAEQHYRQFEPWLRQLGLSTELLTGSRANAAKRRQLSAIAAGETHLVVGTHAVLQENVEFHRLGLGIIDEQHRFGVRQRASLRRKGLNPDMLVMTATPIPRTLTLTVYGDLTLSVIDQLPPGRQPVRTRLLTEGQRHAAYREIMQELKAGRQAYIVYPLVEESGKFDLKAAVAAFEELQQGPFRDYRLGLLHGRLPAEEKEATMRRFQAGELDLLVATTVIEVGVDVPNASLMLVEHAERFGLAQLHQLRGRVGRGRHPSQCLLLAGNRLSDESQQRLQVMASTTDGFRIAEADLAIRGPGEFLGTRQSGMAEFRVANLLRDVKLLELARQEAFRLAESEYSQTDPLWADLLAELNYRWGTRLELAITG